MKSQYSLSDSDTIHPKKQKPKDLKLNDSWVLICESFKLLLGDG